MLKIFSLNFFQVTTYEKFSKKILDCSENVAKKSKFVYNIWHGEVKMYYKKLMMFECKKFQLQFTTSNFCVCVRIRFHVDDKYFFECGPILKKKIVPCYSCFENLGGS